MIDVVVIHESAGVRELVMRSIRREIGDSLHFREAEAYEDTDVATEEAKLTVIGASVPAHTGSTSDHRDHAAAKRYLSQVIQRRPNSNVLVLATDSDDQLCRLVTTLPQGRLASVSPNGEWRKAVRNCAREVLLGDRALDLRRTRTVLHIALSNHERVVWSVERRGAVADTRSGTMVLEPVTYHDLCGKADNLLDQLASQTWNTFLPAVSNDMYAMLFKAPGNAELASAILPALEDPKGVGNVRMVFDLSADAYKLPVETLKKYAVATNAEQWYGLQSAIVRQYKGEGKADPLFWDRESRVAPVDCLLIAADPRAGSGSDGLDPLDQVTYEVDDIAAALRAKRRAGANIGLIKVVKLGSRRHGSATDHLSSALSMHPWRLIHFAGHAEVAPGIGGEHPPTGRLVLSAADAEVLEFSHFARAITDAQFLFVSSCRTGNHAFLQDVIRENVPAVLGYRWPVIDVQARQLAIDFYKALFSPGGPAYQSLGRALTSARKNVFGRYLADVTWASPVLLAKAASQPLPPGQQGLVDPSLEVRAAS